MSISQQIPLTNPYPGPRSVLVMDNCSIHHLEEVRQLVEDEAREQNLLCSQFNAHVVIVCKLIYLPPYSPDYNPIELGFSMIKSFLRRKGDSCTLSTLDEACHIVDSKAAEGFFIASGYM